MNIRLNFLVGVLLSFYVFFSCQQLQEEKVLGNLQIDDAKPVPGQTISIEYLVDSIELEDSYAIFLSEDSFQPVDLLFNEARQAKLSIPDSAVAFVLVPKVNGSPDTNDDDGYLFHLYNEDGDRIDAGELAINQFILNRGRVSGRNYGVQRDLSVVVDSMSRVFNDQPELQSSDWLTTFLSAAGRLNNEKGDSLLKVYREKLEGNPKLSEEEMAGLSTIYSSLGEEQQLDSIRKEAIRQFPNGQIAKQDMLNDIRNETDFNQKKELVKELNSKFSVKEGDLLNIQYEIAFHYFDEKQYQEFNDYVSNLKNEDFGAFLFNSAASKLLASSGDLSMADSYIQKAIEIIDDLSQGESKQPNYSKKEYEDHLLSLKRDLYNTRASIASGEEDFENAVKYQEKTIQDGDNYRYNEQYINYLIKLKKYEEAKESAAQFIKQNASSEQIESNFIEAYNHAHPNRSDANEQLKELESIAYGNAKKEIEKQLLYEDAPQFNLKDLKGESVSLEDYKGKLVVLDFWATWCGPCKMSFPGMQQSIEKHQQDGNVQFLFIDTFENVSTEKERVQLVQDFITENNYDFKVLLDEQAKDGKTFIASDQYGVRGIPVKFVIDKDGKLRYKKVGFESTEKLIKELDILIELLNA